MGEIRLQVGDSIIRKLCCEMRLLNIQRPTVKVYGIDFAVCTETFRQCQCECAAPTAQIRPDAPCWHTIPNQIYVVCVVHGLMPMLPFLAFRILRPIVSYFLAAQSRAA